MAEFKIGFKYKKAKATKVETVTFPYEKKKDDEKMKGDILRSQEDGVPSRTPTDPDVLIRFGGCYVDSSFKKWYLAEWTFPGTWLSNKAGDPIYKNPDKENEYVFAKGKVCVPYNLEDTNAEWAKTYIKYQDSKSGNPTGWSFSGKSYNDDSTANGYTIKAETKDFGYFHWKININCFYALTNNGGGDECIDGGTKCKEDYIIRSFDSEDPFLQSTQTSPRIQYKGKRLIGFNWTADAQLTEFTKDGYGQNPEALVAKIINTKDTYNENNLDYKVHLTKEKLQEIRSRNKGEKMNYDKLMRVNGNNAADQYSKGNGVGHYHSQLLRDLGMGHIDECNNKLCKEVSINE